MAERNKEEAERRKARNAMSRSVQLNGLLIAALFGVNVLIYWERGSHLSLVVAALALVALVAYLVYARRQMRAL